MSTQTSSQTNSAAVQDNNFPAGKPQEDAATAAHQAATKLSNEAFAPPAQADKPPAAQTDSSSQSSLWDSISQAGSNALGALQNLASSDNAEKARKIAKDALMMSNPLMASYALQSKNIELTDSLAQSMSDDGASGYIKQALLAGNEITKLGQTFEHATVYSAIQSPIDGIQQLVNWGLKSADLQTLPPLQIIDALPEAEFNTPEWYAQTLGTGAGMVLGFVATSGVGTGVMAVGRAGQAVEVGNAVLGAGRMARLVQAGETAAKVPGLNTAASGFALGVLTMPVADSDAEDFIQQRLKNGVVTAVSGALVHNGGLALSQMAEAALPGVSQAITRPIANSLAGYGTGVANAEANSLLAGNGITLDIEELHKEGLTWAVMGAGSEAAGILAARSGALSAKQSQQPTESATDSTVPTRAAARPVETIKVTYRGQECEVLYADKDGAMLKRTLEGHPERIMQYVQAKDLLTNYRATEVTGIYQDKTGAFYQVDHVPETQQALLTLLPEVTRIKYEDLMPNTVVNKPAEIEPQPAQSSQPKDAEAARRAEWLKQVLDEPVNFEYLTPFNPSKTPQVIKQSLQLQQSTRDIAPPEPITVLTPKEVAERSRKVFEKVNAAEIPESFFDPVVSRYEGADRQLAQAIVHESMSNVRDLDLMGRARALEKTLQDEGKRLGVKPSIRDTFIADAASEGAFAGYVWRKANGHKLDLLPLESKSLSSVPPGHAALFFDNPANLTPTQRATLQGMLDKGPVFFMDLGNYGAGLNGLDVGLGPQAVSAKVDGLVKSGREIQKAHPDWTPEQVTQELFQGERRRAIEALGPNAHMLTLKPEDIPQRQPATPDAVAAFAADLRPEIQREAINMLRDLDFKTFSNMADEAVRMKAMVDESARMRGIDPVKESPLYVSGTESAITDGMSSDGMMNYIYRYANNIPKEQFVTKSQLLKMQENGQLTYTAPDGTVKNRRVIFMDDTVYSGTQVNDSLRNLEKIPDLTVLTLGMYSNWEKQFMRNNNTVGPDGQPRVREILPLKTNFTMHTKDDPGAIGLPPEDLAARRELVDFSPGYGGLGSFQIFPYMTPDNSVKIIARFARDVLGIQSARFEID